MIDPTRDAQRLRELIEKWRDSVTFLVGLPATKDLPSVQQDIARFRCCADELEAVLVRGTVSPPEPATLCVSCATDGPNPPNAAILCRACVKEICADYERQLAAASASTQPDPLDYRALYSELLYAVERKFAHETRHETALRYIREAERNCIQGPARQEPRHAD